MNKHTTLDQLRAKHAWGAVARILKKGGPVRLDYKREVKRLPVQIQTTGLGQALGFLYAKSDGNRDAKGLLLKDLEKWLLDERGSTNQPDSSPGRNRILYAIIYGDAEFLRRMTRESLRYLQWLARFTEAEIKED